MDRQGQWPRVSRLGVDGVLVSFGDSLSEAANRAAIAFSAALQKASPTGVLECSSSLCSAYVRLDLEAPDLPALIDSIGAIAEERDWRDAPLPDRRRLWRIPTVFDPALCPQLEEAATLANLSPDAVAASICASPLRVLTIGFAPGQPYLGELPENWSIPRQKSLTERVPVGALTVAIRQLVLFAVESPTGWRHIGQTAFRAFRPESDAPFALRSGDEALFTPVAAETLPQLQAEGPDGGATAELIS